MMKCIELFKVNLILENVNICEKVFIFKKKKKYKIIFIVMIMSSFNDNVEIIGKRE